MVTVEEARGILKAHIQLGETTVLPIVSAVGKILAQDIISQINVPSFHNSAMDGYCFGHENDRNRYKIGGQIQAGDTHLDPVHPGFCSRIYTGAMIPDGADTVVQQELVTIEGDEIVFDSSKIIKGANVRLEGSQNLFGDVLASRGTKITPSLVGLLASIGVSEVEVIALPNVSIVITGNELVEVGEPLQKGQIYNSNEFALKALFSCIGIMEVQVFKAEDSLESVTKAIKMAKLNSDFVVVTGGISVGDFDFVRQAMLDIGANELFYKIKQKPGKPLWVGKITNQWFFALPGNPAAVVTCFNQYLKPVILSVAGHSNAFLPIAGLPLQNSFKKKSGLTHFLKGQFTVDGVRILDAQESFNMKSFNQANCIVEVAAELEDISTGTILRVYPLPE